MKKASWVKLHADHLAAANEFDCELAFIEMIRVTLRRSAPLQALKPGLEPLLEEGIIVQVPGGYIPACVYEAIESTARTSQARSAAGQATQQNRRKLLQNPTKDRTDEAGESKPQQTPTDKIREEENRREENNNIQAADAAPGKPGKKRTKLEDFPEGFRRLWLAGAPESRARSGLAEAFKAWQGSGAAKDPERAISAISAMVKSRAWQGGYAPGLHRWLKAGGWMHHDEGQPNQTDYLEGFEVQP